MTNPAHHSPLMLGSNLCMPIFALALVCALTMVVTQPLQAQTFTVLHSFTGGQGGSLPYAGLAMDKAGNLYGTTATGGYTGGDCANSPGCGTVFKLSHKGSGWIFSPLYSFQGGNDGAFPEFAGLTIGPDGGLYGVTGAGGGGSCSGGGCGAIYNLKPPASACKAALCYWSETVLYRFQGSPDGERPVGKVVFDTAGDIYGTTYEGGSGWGTVYELSPSQEGWTESIVHSFNGSDGNGTWSGVILDSAGNLYGVTAGGGAYNSGAVYQLKPSGSGWTENLLYSFQGLLDGGSPYGGLIFDQLGNLYGSTFQDGSLLGGTAFELAPANGSFNLLYSFDGSYNLCDVHNSWICNGPWDSLTMDAVGNLYGTTWSDGIHGAGNVFRLTPSNGSWAYTDLYDFTGGSDGGYPAGGVVLDAKGNLYGTATGSFGNLLGVVWEITP